jgi:hypothetical protein
MAVLSVQSAALAGSAVTYAAAGVAGDSFPNTGQEALHVKNGGIAPITVTIDSPTLCNQGFAHDLAVAVPNGSDRIIGKFPKDRFGTTVAVTYSDDTDVTVAVLKTGA